MPELSPEELNQLKDDLRIVKFQLQAINDQLEGRIKSSNVIEYRNTMIFNDWGNCDETYPFIMDFELISEMTKLVECKVSFKIRNFNVGIELE